MTQCNETTSEGLYAKYEVRKGGEPVEDCFVLRPGRDAAARVALLAYAYATDDLKLRGDLHRWVQTIQDALGPDEQAAVMRTVYESALADATSRAVAARREAENAEFALEYTQQTFVAALPGGRRREDDVDADLQDGPPRPPPRGSIEPEPGERGYRPTRDEL